jgi:hypothetical protein
VSLRDRLLAPCATLDLSTEQVTLDDDALLARLLLFDVYVLRSFQLKELPALVGLFGYDGLRALLREGALRFHSYRLFAGHLERRAPGLAADQMRYSLKFEAQEPARLDFYEITNVKVATPEEIKLKTDVANRLVKIPADYAEASTAQTHLDLDHDVSGLRRAITRNLGVMCGLSTSPNDVDVRVDREGPIAVHVESNLVSQFGLNPLAAHMVVGESLLALSRLNARIEDMRLCSAVAGSRDDELPFVEDKLSFLLREVAPEAQLDRLGRIIDVFGLPALAGAVKEGRINAERFIEVRNSSECREFRAWLREIDEVSEDEIRDRVNSLNARLGNLAHRAGGKSTRLLVMAGIGLIPLVGPLASLGVGALDSFLLDEVLPESGPAMFLSNMYPSIFDS